MLMSVHKHTHKTKMLKIRKSNVIPAIFVMLHLLLNTEYNKD